MNYCYYLLLYSTDDVKSAARWRLLNYWRKKRSPLQIIELLTSKDWTIDGGNLGTRLRYLTKREMARVGLQVWVQKIFWMNNKAIIEFGFCRIWRILQISEGVIHRGRRPRWITPSSTRRIFHILQKPNSIVANYSKSCQIPVRQLINEEIYWRTEIKFTFNEDRYISQTNLSTNNL